MSTIDENVANLRHLIESELENVTIDKWGYFFPMHLAVWRYIQSLRPSALGELDAGYDKDPYFKGKGSKWFTHVLANEDGYIDLLEQIMYSIVERLPKRALDRGSVTRAEIPSIGDSALKKLAKLIERAVDEGSQAGRIT